MSDHFIFGGTDCRTYGVRAFEKETYGAAPIDYNVVSVPGKNGDLLFSQGRYANRAISYGCVIFTGDSLTDINNTSISVTDAAASYASFRAYVMSKVGYQRLVDSKYPDLYFMAYMTNELKPDVTPDAGMIRFDITFMRKPQRFLVSGDIETILTASGTITNPTLYDAKPLIRVYGNGVLGVGSQSITVTNNANSYMDIDCDAGLAYRGSVNMNGYITLSGIDFPVLSAGTNNIALGTGITKAKITPRWWTI